MKMDKKGRAWVFVLIVVVLLFFVSIFLAGIVSLFLGEDSIPLTGNVAVIPIKGIITSQSGSGFGIDDEAVSEDTIELIDKAERSPTIEAIVFEINSPGGSAVASDEIARRIKAVEKPTVAWIREVGASGGYWIASSTDHIVANRMSITGSIGVIASYLEFSGFLADHNVTYQRFVTGKYKDLASPFRQPTQTERMLFQRELDTIHDFFVDEVAANRNMPRSKVKEIATGLFYTGIRAKDLGLVDQLGSEEEVKKYLEKQLGAEVKLIEYQTKKGFFQQLSEAISEPFFWIGKGIGSSVISETETVDKVGLRA